MADLGYKIKIVNCVLCIKYTKKLRQTSSSKLNVNQELTDINAEELLKDDIPDNKKKARIPSKSRLNKLASMDIR